MSLLEGERKELVRRALGKEREGAVKWVGHGAPRESQRTYGKLAQHTSHSEKVCSFNTKNLFPNEETCLHSTLSPVPANLV